MEDDEDRQSATDLLDLVPKWLMLVVCLAIMGLTLCGNVPVAISLLHFRRMKGVTTVFVISLVMASLLVGVGVTSMVTLQMVWPGSVSGSACQIPIYLETACVTVSIYSLVAVTIDRYVAVIHPTSKFLTLKVAGAIVVVVWLGGVIYASRFAFQHHLQDTADTAPLSTLPTTPDLHPNLSTPTTPPAQPVNHTAHDQTVSASPPTTTTASAFIPNTVSPKSRETLDNNDGSPGDLDDDDDDDDEDEEDEDELEDEDEDDVFCNLFVEEAEDDLPYRVMDLVFLFFIPALSVSCIYYRIAKKLWETGQPMSSTLAKKRRVVKMFIVTIVFFLLCWIPFYAVDCVTDSLKIVLGDDVEDQIESNPVYLIFRCLFILLALANSFITPIIFIWFSDKVREDTKRFFLSPCGLAATSQESQSDTGARIVTSSSDQMPASSSSKSLSGRPAGRRKVFGLELPDNRIAPLSSGGVEGTVCHGADTAGGKLAPRTARIWIGPALDKDEAAPATSS